MTMKLATVERGLARVLDALRCPICGAALTLNGGALRCAAGHTFDLSAKGYVNLAPGRDQSREKYDAALFESRRRVFEAGFYAPVVQAAGDALARCAPGAVIADVGCGEGYYARALAARYPAARVIGLDLSRDAIRAAARGGAGEIAWLVADLKKLPIAEGALDAALDVLTPADYAAFRRALKPDGWLIKVIPAERYLKEIRSEVADEIKNAEFSSERVEAHLRENMNVVDEVEIEYQRPTDEAQSRDFLRMTPMTFGVREARLSAIHLSAVTIHMKLLLCKRP